MGSDAERVAGLYERHAADWVRARLREATLYERPWLQRFEAAMPSREADRFTGSVLDLGCGPGEPIARYFAERGYAVTGVDSSAAMVAMFRERLPEQEAICADMRGIDLGRRFEGILAWDSFFHLNHDDQRLMFPIFRKHAAPGAALRFTSGPSHGVAMGELEGEQLFHSSLDTEEYRKLLGEAGFEVVAHVGEDDVCGGRTVWLTRLR